MRYCDMLYDRVSNNESEREEEKFNLIECENICGSTLVNMIPRKVEKLTIMIKRDEHTT